MRKIEPEADGVVKDGQVISFRMTMMDAAAQREIADKFGAHKPHHVAMTSDQRNAAIERQTAYDKRISDAWKSPSPLFADPAPVTDGKAHDDRRSIDGQVKDAGGLDALQAANERRYAAKISEMWKNPGAR